MKPHKHEIFKMNKTFHKHVHSKGLGLYITKNQVEAMGGPIEVHGKVNEGTEFAICFDESDH